MQINPFRVRMLLLIVLSAWCTASAQPEEAAMQATYYVSPSGNDQNAGTESAPFKTIEKARKAVRQINQAMTGDILVMVGGGEYPIHSTIFFDHPENMSYRSASLFRYR